MINLLVNGELRRVDGEPETPLLWVIRDSLGPQCGYCQAGQIMTAAALLARTPQPTDADIDEAMAGNICRCGTYSRIYGLSAVLYGEVTPKDGRVEQTNFHDYQVVRMPEAPAVEMHVVPSEEKPAGIGEPGTALVGPAVANAVFAATGQRLRSLPLRLA